ncbi:hypothetical protein C2S51_030452 [Perilla frutescens var. frutescens]|nr:hypothetical protein C2S51_030452 [Perilla frutescens var. frutescens]
MLRSIIGSDIDLLCLFTMEPEPTVYLVHNQNIGDTQPESFTVHDVMTQPESSTHYPTNTQPDPYSYVPQFDFSAQPSFHHTDDNIECGGSPFHDAQNDDVAADSNGIVETDDDYDDEADLDVPFEDDEEPFRTGFSNSKLNQNIRIARNVRAKAVAAYYARKMRREEKIMKPQEIMAELLHEFGIRAGYQVALRARNVAISMIYGGHIDSYQKLPSYLYMLKV